MKKLFAILFVLMVILTASAIAQPNVATQNLSLNVSAVTLLTVSGNPGALDIITGTAGIDALTGVSEATTTYSITHNKIANKKITAQMSGTALTAGITLKVTLTSGKGISIPNVDLSDANAYDVVTTIGKGADQSKTITYNFAALASSGEFTSARVVTLTLTD